MSTHLDLASTAVPTERTYSPWRARRRFVVMLCNAYQDIFFIIATSRMFLSFQSFLDTTSTSVNSFVNLIRPQGQCRLEMGKNFTLPVRRLVPIMSGYPRLNVV